MAHLTRKWTALNDMQSRKMPKQGEIKALFLFRFRYPLSLDTTMNFFRRYGPPSMRGAKMAVQFACFVHCFNQYVGQITWCVGPSMLPNFSMSGLVAVEHVSQHYRDLEIGDVIICMSPAKPGRSVLKRVIGLPGDNICKDPTVKEREYIDVPQGHVWVGGDNLSNSNDSRSYGPVAMGLIKGRVFAKVWPEVELLKSNFVPLA